MNADLEATLDELGSGYRDLVMKMRAAYEPLPMKAALKAASRRGRVAGWTVGYLIAASLVVLLGVGLVFRHDRALVQARLARYPKIYTVAYAADEAALQSIVASQRSDGSWENDYLTRQNAAALRRAADLDSRIAYKKAVRYLKSRGLSPLSETALAQIL